MAAAAFSAASASSDRIAFLAQVEGRWQVLVAQVAAKADARPASRSARDRARVSWYPDGKHVLVNSIEGAMLRMDTETGAEEPIPTPIAGILDAVLSPDGKSIAFSVGTAQSRDANDIWLTNTKGTGLKRLVSMPFLQHWPTWSRDGRWIYFLSSDMTQSAPQQDIWRVSVDGNTREQVTTGGLFNFDVGTGPGDLIAYSSNRSGNYEIWIQKGTDPPRQVTDHPAVDGGPAWNADGTALIFESNRGGSMNLWYLDLAGEKPAPPRQLTHHEGGARGAAWWHPPASR